MDRHGSGALDVLFDPRDMRSGANRGAGAVAPGPVAFGAGPWRPSDDFASVSVVSGFFRRHRGVVPGARSPARRSPPLGQQLGFSDWNPSSVIMFSCGVRRA